MVNEQMVVWVMEVEETCPALYRVPSSLTDVVPQNETRRRPHVGGHYGFVVAARRRWAALLSTCEMVSVDGR